MSGSKKNIDVDDSIDEQEKYERDLAIPELDKGLLNKIRSNTKKMSKKSDNESDSLKEIEKERNVKSHYYY